MNDNLIIGNIEEPCEIGTIVTASYKGNHCNVKIVREATAEEYIEYMKEMNFEVGRYHGPYYYAGVAD